MQDAATNYPIRRHGSYVVFEQATGKIVSLFHVEVMEGALAPRQNEIAHEAIRSAARQTGKNVASLHALAVGPEEIKRGARYIVDVKSRRLREI